MSNIILLEGYREEKGKKKINTIDEKILPRTIEEYLILAKNFKEDVLSILDKREGILRVTPQELEKILKNRILDFLIKKRQISSELFMCGDYISIILRKFICGDFNLSKFTQDFLEEGDWKGAGDINLVKYIYGISKRRKEVNTPKDYKDRATVMYYNAYTRGQLKLGYNLASNLDALDKIVDLPTLLRRVIPPNLALVG